MVFNSLSFVLFFVAVLAARYSPLRWTARKWILTAASYVFYAGWHPELSLLLALSTVIDWWAAARIHRAESARTRRWWLALSLASNLGLLAFFKYGDFGLRSVEALARLLGIEASLPVLGLTLPVGISFYTFQTLSYTLDVYRGSLRPVRSITDFALYVAFFPQLVAGPIVRAADFLPQLDAPRRPTSDSFSWGLVLLLLGLFQKDVADHLLAPSVDLAFGTPTPTTFDAWVGTIAFSAQIFLDFAGYSTCAIGVALCLGFVIVDNFRFPYAAAGFSDFWKRWHISLSGWLRDYLYIPLGGNRQGPSRTQVNLMLTMLLGGLWHGAAWTFVVWGALHGAFLIAERWLRAALGDRLASGPWLTFAQCGATYVGVCVAWVFFRAPSLEVAWAMLRSMIGLSEHSVPVLTGERAWLPITIVGALIGTHTLLRRTTLESVVDGSPGWLRGLGLGALVLGVVLLSGEDRAFIYFQF